jgi:hypothetical protein
MAEDVQLPDELLNLSNAIEKYPESFASGSDDIQASALIATKFVFDLGAVLEFHVFLVHSDSMDSIYSNQIREGFSTPCYRIIVLPNSRHGASNSVTVSRTEWQAQTLPESTSKTTSPARNSSSVTFRGWNER